MLRKIVEGENASRKPPVIGDLFPTTPLRAASYPTGDFSAIAEEVSDSRGLFLFIGSTEMRRIFFFSSLPRFPYNIDSTQPF